MTSYSTTSDPHSVSELEASQYYADLSSRPRLLYRTGAAWSLPNMHNTEYHEKELRPVGRHPIVGLWEDGLAWKVVAALDKNKVIFSSVDVVRFLVGSVFGPTTIWIGVIPASTSASTAHDAAQDIHSLLKTYKIHDMDVDFRESYYLRMARLYTPVDINHPHHYVLSCLSSALSVPISLKAESSSEGSLGLYLMKGQDTTQYWGLTCHHVVFQPHEDHVDFTYREQFDPPRDVIVLGTQAFQNVLDLMERRTTNLTNSKPWWAKTVAKQEALPEDERNQAVLALNKSLIDLADLEIPAIAELRDRIKRDWSEPSARTIGRVVRSPPKQLQTGDAKFTEDWALVAIDPANLGPDFKGNVIDLNMIQFPKGDPISREKFTDTCFPRGDAHWTFEYPEDGLLRLQDYIPANSMKDPDMEDAAQEPCFIVFKSGPITGTTMGRANAVKSVGREWDAAHKEATATSIEWCIINHDKGKAFSMPGDSGSIIADIRGRVGGLLTAGAGMTDSTDMSYATPYEWLIKRIQAQKGFEGMHFNIPAARS